MTNIVKGLKICGVSSAVPVNRVASDEIISGAPIMLREQLKKAKVISGINSRRIALPNQSASDFCEYAASQLLNALDWKPEDISLVIFISQTPDFQMPATACSLQHRLGIPKSACAFDINLACSGFTHGLWVAGKLLEGNKGGRALLLVGDTLSKIISPTDWSNRMIFGDAGSAVCLEFDEDQPGEITNFIMGTDGSGVDSVVMPSRTSSDPNSGFVMKGLDVFLFASRVVPKAIKDICNLTAYSLENVDFIIPHQASGSILRNISDKAGIDSKKIINELAEYGNTTSSSIPLAIVSASDHVDFSHKRLIFVGFGAGLSWSATLINFKNVLILPILEI